MTDTTTEGWTPWGGLYVGAPTTLAECPIGLFVHDLGCLCLKTEYGNNEGRIDAYIIGSGEFFWGDNPQTIARQRKQIVRPVSPAPAVPDPVAAAVEAEREACLACAEDNDKDEREQNAFEAWAKANRYDMHQHPLHWLFLNDKTSAARAGWKAALEYVQDAIRARSQGGRK